jgi:hypothetical protein
MATLFVNVFSVKCLAWSERQKPFAIPAVEIALVSFE